MVQYIPMIILMAIFGAIGLYWVIGTRHFITWSRKYKTSFPRFSDNQILPNGSHSAVISRVEPDSFLLIWGVRLTGLALTGVAVASIVNMIIVG